MTNDESIEKTPKGSSGFDFLKKETTRLTEPNSDIPSLVVSDVGQDDPVILENHSDDPVVNSLIDKRYNLLSLIGHGTTTSVYKAQDIKLNREVAIKILHTHALSNEQTVSRFQNESNTLGLLRHRNIVSMYGIGSAGSHQPYMVMEYVAGTSLKDLLSQSGCLAQERALKIFVQVCAALETAHAAGVVHRDLKPANIMVTTSSDGTDVVKILDFGVAKLLPIQGETFQTRTQTGELLGTLPYMSPEQCLDQDLDGRSDIYSLGCVMFEALTGTLPLCGRTAFETMNKHLTEMPQHFVAIRPDLHLSMKVEEIVRKAVAKDPIKRYKHAADLENDLNEILNSHAFGPECQPGAKDLILSIVKPVQHDVAIMMQSCRSELSTAVRSSAPFVRRIKQRPVYQVLKLLAAILLLSIPLYLAINLQWLWLCLFLAGIPLVGYCGAFAPELVSTLWKANKQAHYKPILLVGFFSLVLYLYLLGSWNHLLAMLGGIVIWEMLFRAKLRTLNVGRIPKWIGSLIQFALVAYLSFNFHWIWLGVMVEIAFLITRNWKSAYFLALILLMFIAVSPLMVITGVSILSLTFLSKQLADRR